MKRYMFKKVLIFLLCSVMLCSPCTGCTAPSSQPVQTPAATVTTFANGNISTAPAEVGTEEELTAVREKLIKSSEIEGLGDITKMELYENGVRVAHDNYVQVCDNKKIYYAGDIKRVVNYPDGYRIDLPQDWIPDYTLSTARSRYTADGVTFTAADETDHLPDYTYARMDVTDEAEAPYAAGEEYIAQMFRFITAEEYLRENNIEKLYEETVQYTDDMRLYILKMHLRDCGETVQSYYTYAVFYSELRLVHTMFKCVDDRDFSAVYNTFCTVADKGYAMDTVAYPEGDNPSWAPETKELYDSLMNTDEVIWGLFYGNVEYYPLRKKYPMIEKQLDYRFELVSSYTDNIKGDFPVQEALAVNEEGRFLQYNYHFEYIWNNSPGKSAPILDVYRGEMDEDLRRTARQIVEYGKPMLLRVNNEMNSTWTTWSAINSMLDPEIFTETWIRMYEIFEEEGANAYCIWVWNPQSANSFPNTNWNDLRLYMPGANYMDMLGLTSYNFGTADNWGTFEYLYQCLENYYSVHFGDWGWVISEFGCSDETDDPDRKAAWITNMFDCFEADMFPNIKAAVWFNANDYDGNGNITHEIVLGSDPNAVKAFKDGLARQKGDNT